jgi:anion-transporting  ArsA/GET3 family ATPase
MRPNVLAGFMEKKVMTWLIKPFHFAQRLGAGRLFKAGGRLMSGISSITGVKMLQMLSEFLVLMEDVIRGFNLAGEKVSTLLRQPSTNFVLVAAPHHAAVRSAENLLRELQTNQYPLGALLINRCFPGRLAECLRAWHHQPELAGPYEPGLKILDRAHQNSEQMVSQLQNLVQEHLPTDPPILKIEEQKAMIHSIDSLLDFSQVVAGSGSL